MYNSLDPSQVLTIEHLESLVNVHNVQRPDARVAKRPRLDDKENVPVPVEPPLGNEVNSILKGNLSDYPTRYESRQSLTTISHLKNHSELLQLQSSLLQALTEISGEMQKRF